MNTKFHMYTFNASSLMAIGMKINIDLMQAPCCCCCCCCCCFTNHRRKT